MNTAVRIPAELWHTGSKDVPRALNKQRCTYTYTARLIDTVASLIRQLTRRYFRFFRRETHEEVRQCRARKLDAEGIAGEIFETRFYDYAREEV